MHDLVKPNFYSRKVYFSDRSLDYPRIESVSMDGNDRTTIVGNELSVPNMLAIDVEVTIQLDLQCQQLSK